MAAGFSKDINDYLHSQVALADAKAAGILAAALTIGAAIVHELTPVGALATGFWWLSIAALGSSVGVTAYVIFPRLPSGRRGLIFFEDIPHQRAVDVYVRESAAISDADVEKEFAAQNYFISGVVHDKYWWVQRGIVLFVIGVAAGLIAFLAS